MQVAAIIATIAAAIIAALLTPWWARRLERKPRTTQTTPPQRPFACEPDFSKLPASVRDPGIQEGVRRLFTQTHGRAPTDHELYDELNRTIVDTATPHVLSNEEVKQVEDELGAEP